jgi:dienelactone hydrolase
MLVVALLLALAPQGATPDLGAELARVVDLPTPAARAKASRQLANTAGVTLEAWQRACAGFGRFPALEPGPDRQVVDLQVLDKVETTEVFLYVPKGYAPDKPAPLLLAGHGTGTTGAREYLRWQATADQLGMLVLAPSESGPNVGWASTPRERAVQLAALRWARRRANVDENRIYVTGISRGGHMTWDLVLRHRDQFAAAAPCIGGPRIQLQGGQNNLRYLENVLSLPIRDLQGSGDDPLLLQNLHLAFARLDKLAAADAKLIEFQDRGHDFDQAAVDWAQLFALRREPVPKVVLRAVAEPTEARSFWLEVLQCDRNVAVEFSPQVAAEVWSKLDEAGKRAYLQDRIVERTARLRVEMSAPGHFAADGKLVVRFRLLLTRAMLAADGKVEVSWQGKVVGRKPQPSAAVLLGEFAERFDRSFLPLCEVVLP